MRKLRAFAIRLRGLFRARPSAADFAAELESHVALHTEDGVRAHSVVHMVRVSRFALHKSAHTDGNNGQ